MLLPRWLGHITSHVTSFLLLLLSPPGLRPMSRHLFFSQPQPQPHPHPHPRGPSRFRQPRSLALRPSIADLRRAALEDLALALTLALTLALAFIRSRQPSALGAAGVFSWSGPAQGCFGTTLTSPWTLTRLRLGSWILLPSTTHAPFSGLIALSFPLMKLTDCAQTDSAQRFCLDDRRPGPLFVQIILNPDRLYAYPAHLSPSSSVGHNAPLVLQCWFAQLILAVFSKLTVRRSLAVAVTVGQTQCPSRSRSHHTLEALPGPPTTVDTTNTTSLTSVPCNYRTLSIPPDDRLSRTLQLACSRARSLTPFTAQTASPTDRPTDHLSCTARPTHD
ncbi:uncharacterized protein J3D65DRAFT_602062 [Phyllosticta citribraziliensis]|uniref:Uncharacterized protein n=1 Tax=Phyllosticta citribraziliensis TaxID=989973 RepID=A0ABR1LZP3_9PEZI